MRFIICALAFFFTSPGIANSNARRLVLESGYVLYEVKVKTLGIGGEKVSAINREVIGEIIVNNDGGIEGGLIIPIVEFDSNNTKRDKDIANILKYREHPAITFEIADIAKENVERILSSDSGYVSIKAKLTAVGKSKTYDITLKFRSDKSNKIHFIARINARFSDFGIKPPRMGLILKRALDEIYLYGDLIFKVEEN